MPDPSPVDYLDIPSYILKDRTLKVLESIVEYLKDQRGLTYREIGTLLNRNERTIWTVYQRARRKRQQQYARTR